MTPAELQHWLSSHFKTKREACLYLGISRTYLDDMLSGTTPVSRLVELATKVKVKPHTPA
jgi:hypothetical protein